jgi:glycosyltransferase involved in cell wall biosynthesis
VIGVLRDTEFQKTLSLSTPIVNFKCSEIPVIRNIQLAKKLHHYLCKEKFDILQTHFAESEIYGSIGAYFCRIKPLILSTRRNMYHWTQETPWQFRICRFLTKQASQVIANSYAVQQKCQELESVFSDKITVIPNAVEVEKFQGISSKKAKKMLNIDPDTPVIGVVGNWRPVKGLVFFLRAAAQIHAAIPSAQFILAGQGSQENELKDLAKQLGIYSNTRFLKNHPDIPSVIAAFDIAVQSSLSESFSNVLLEYMASGKPIVSTDVGDASIVLDHGKSGFIVPPGSPTAISKAVLQLCNNETFAAQLGKTARKKVLAQWSLSALLKRYEHFYKHILMHSTK